MSGESRTTDNDDLVRTDRRGLEENNAPSSDQELATANQQLVQSPETILVAGKPQNTADENRLRNQALVTYWVLPLIFLTVVLLGGLRVSSDDGAFIFLPPPLITLVLAVLLMLLFVRGGLIEWRSWVTGSNSPLQNVSHIWVLLTLFFASAQAFNSVLPERGLLHWLFSFFFLWTLWNNQFSSFDARRLLRSMVVLFGTAFVLKHMLLASFYAPDGGWLKRIASALAQGVTLGTLDAPMFAPATGYISFFTLGLYIVGLMMIAWKQTANSKRQTAGGHSAF